MSILRTRHLTLSEYQYHRLYDALLDALCTGDRFTPPELATRTGASLAAVKYTLTGMVQNCDAAYSGGRFSAAPRFDARNN